MAYSSIIFKNPSTGKSKFAPVGFSWTTLFFGFLPALFRGDWKWALIMFVLLVLTAGLASFVFMFIYNKLYIKGLIKAGYKAESVAGGDLEYIESKMNIKIPQL